MLHSASKLTLSFEGDPKMTSLQRERRERIIRTDIWDNFQNKREGQKDLIIWLTTFLYDLENVWLQWFSKKSVVILMNF